MHPAIEFLFLYFPQPEFPSRRFYQNTIYTCIYYTALSFVYTRNHKNNIMRLTAVYSTQASPVTG